MTEHRQSESRLGDEHIAGHELERRAGRIGNVLVVAGSDDTKVFAFNTNLRRAKDVTGGMEADLGAVERQLLAIADGLRPAGEVVAVTQAHDVEGFLGGEHGLMSRPRMV